VDTDIPSSHRDLLDQDVAVVSTIDPEERPQSTVVWFLVQDGEIKLSLNGTRRKVRNLRRRPGISVLILDLTNPMRYLEVRGSAVVEDDVGGTFAAAVGEKYGVDLASFDEPGDRRVVVTVKPAVVNPVDMSGS
jgi:PPOX class probable F420-dependent enzyme